MDESTLREQYEKVAENGAIEKWERDVKTPVASGDTEENRMVAYVVAGADLIVRVAKVSTMGWATSAYTMGGDIIDVGGPYVEEEATAHDTAKERVQEVLA